MLKLYKEHLEFDEFTRFDTKTGKLVAISENEFKSFLPEGFQEKPVTEQPIQRIETPIVAKTQEMLIILIPI